MDEPSKNLWYQLGYTLERARAQPTRERVRALGEKLAAFRTEGQGEVRRGAGRGETVAAKGGARRGPDGAEGMDWLIASISGALVSGMLRNWKPRARPGGVHLARAAAAGAAGMIFQELTHLLLSDDPAETARRSRTLGDRLLSGTARGLVYGAIAEPRLPGPPVIRGVIYGSVEYLLSPLGGLGKLLGRETPYGRFPLLRSFLDTAGRDDDGYVEHLVFGLALALMAGETVRRQLVVRGEG